MASDGTGGGGALVNLGELSKPATTLIEKVSDAVGGIAKPWQIVRVAKAEAKAELIRAQAKVETSEIEQRAIIRMVREEGKRQENIENITAKAIPYLSAEAKPENVDNDWIAHFFDRSRLVSDVEMQTMWAKILAGEANVPGTFSKKTIEITGSLDKYDANLFTNFCTFCWEFGIKTPIITDIEEPLYSRAGLDFMSLTHLNDIGLIVFDNMSGYNRLGLQKSVTIFYYGRPLTIEFPGELNSLAVGRVILTRAGLQLAAISGSTGSNEYFYYMINQWLSQGSYSLSTPINARPTTT